MYIRTTRADSNAAGGAARPDVRLISIDVFRGLTILLMILVNDLGQPSFRNVPALLRHAPEEISGMTVADLVFPAFLFTVGLSIPIAVQRRRTRGEPTGRIVRHVLLRTVELLILGVYMVNIHGLDSRATGMSKDLWTLLFVLAAIAVWNRYPKAAGAGNILWIALRLAGAAVLILLAVVYRGHDGGRITWMHTSWWGILGLIGWAYGVCSLVYLLSRGAAANLMGALSLLVCLYIGDQSGVLKPLGVLCDYVWLGGHIGGHSAITMAGVIVGVLLTGSAEERATLRRIAGVVFFGAGLLAAGRLLEPLYGISKVRAPRRRGVYIAPDSAVRRMHCCIGSLTSGVARGEPGWSPPPGPTRSAYLLPSLIYAALGVAGITVLQEHLTVGWTAVGRAALFAVAMLVLTSALARCRIRLAL